MELAKALTMDRRGQLGGLAGMVTAIISIIVISGLGIYTLATMNSTGNLSTSAGTTFANGISVIGNVVDWLPLIVVAVIGGFVLTLFLRK